MIFTRLRRRRRTQQQRPAFDEVAAAAERAARPMPTGSLAAMLETSPRPEVSPAQPVLWQRLVFLLTAAGAVVAAATATAAFLAGHTEPGWWAVGAAAGLLTVAVAAAARWPTTQGDRVVAGVVILASLALMAAGAVTSVVIDDRVQPSGSQRAEIVDVGSELHDDLMRIADADALLSASDSEVRAQSRELDEVADLLQETAADYANREPDDFPDSRLVEAAQHVAAAADAGHLAALTREDLLATPDAGQRAQLDRQRNALVEHSLEAGALLNEISADLEVDFGPAADGVVE